VRALFHILGVDYEDRDVSMSAAWRDEMEVRVGARLQLPRVFVNGVCTDPLMTHSEKPRPL
jgi:glutaredoxin